MAAEQTSYLLNLGVTATDTESKYTWDIAPVATVLCTEGPYHSRP
jgi:hypothetical protein